MSLCRLTSLAGIFLSLVTVTRYFPSRTLMTLSVLHAGVSTLFSSSAFTLAAVFSVFDLALCLVVSRHHSTQTCAQGSTRLHVWWSLGCSLYLVGLLAVDWICCDKQGIRAFLLFFSIFCIGLCTVTGIFDDLVDVLHLRESSVFAAFCAICVIGTNCYVPTRQMSTRVTLSLFLHGLRVANLALHRT